MSGFGDEWIRFGATSEHTVDGSFSERTMALSTPYPGITPPYKGNITETQDDSQCVDRARASRGHPGQLPRQWRRRHRHDDDRGGARAAALSASRRATEDHALHADQRRSVRRIKAAGAVPALFTSYAYYNSDKFRFYGEEMMKHCMAFRSLLDAGIQVAAGSDFSPGPFDPRMAIQGMVTRTGWDGKTWGANQRITVDEALRVNTINGAYNSHEEAIKGSITAGKLADFVVLADDLFTVDKAKIKDIQIVRTVVGGATVYQA